MSTSAPEQGRKNLLQTINDSHGLPIQQFEDFSEENKAAKTDGIITLGGMCSLPTLVFEFMVSVTAEISYDLNKTKHADVKSLLNFPL